MRDYIQNRNDFVIGMMAGGDYTDLTKYTPDFDFARDVQFETFQYGGQETAVGVPTGAMTAAALTGYVINNQDPSWREIFRDGTDLTFMIRSKDNQDTFALHANINVDGIDTSGGVLTKQIPLQVSGGDWYARIAREADFSGISNGSVAEKSYVFVYLESALTANLAVQEGDTGNSSAISELTFSSSTSAPSFYFHPLTAGTGKDVELDGSPADKAKVLWGIATVRE